MFGALLGSPAVSLAHEVPARVAVQAFVKHDSGVVRVLVRVPMEAMRDVEFPIRGAGYLDLARADEAFRDAARLWVADAITLVADGVTLPTGTVVVARASLPSDRAFESFISARGSFARAPLDSTTDIPVGQAMLDVMLTYPVASPAAHLAMSARFAHLGVKTSTVLHVVNSDGDDRAFLYDGDQGLIPLEPGWWYAASRFALMGMTHLFGGLDHLLFLLCLIIPVRRIRPVIGIVTAFTVAHSITLAAAALGYAPTALWFPPLVEMLIAVSIVVMAIENMIGPKLDRRWMVAFGFGLVHGFAFSYALSDSLQFAGGHLVTALAAFNLGIEMAQLVAIAVAIPVLAWLFTHAVGESAGTLVASVLIAHSAWHWMTERFDLLSKYSVSWPAFDAAFAIGALRGAIVALVAGAAVWAMSGMMTRLSASTVRGSAPLVALCAGLAGLAALGAAPASLRAQAPVVSTMSGVYTAEQAVKGRNVFMGACTGCHTVASHSGAAFATRWMTRPLSAFYDYVSHLMPKSAPGTLSEDEYVWVTAYVLKLNGMPPSTRELSADPELLKRIRIDSTQVSAAGRSQGEGPQGARIR